MSGISAFRSYSYQNEANSSLLSSMFGTSTTSGSSLLSSLGDWNMIRSGTYKKAISAYYAKASDTDTISESGKADSNIRLSSLKSTAKAAYEAANALKNAEYSSQTKAEDLLEDTKKFVNGYNNMINSTKDMNSYSILQTAVWGTEQMNISEGLLNKVGITIDEKNNLVLNEEEFKKADISNLKTLFSGSGSLADRVAQKASTLYNQSTNQLSVNQGKSLYTMNGMLI